MVAAISCQAGFVQVLGALADRVKFVTKLEMKVVGEVAALDEAKMKARLAKQLKGVSVASAAECYRFTSGASSRHESIYMEENFMTIPVRSHVTAHPGGRRPLLACSSRSLVRLPRTKSVQREM